MKILNALLAAVCVAASAAALFQWRTLQALRAENAALRAHAEAARAQEISTASAEAQKREAELRQLRADARDAVRLRGEITQLRGASKDADSARAQTERLRAENQQLRHTAPAPDSAAPAPGHFPRESWSFAGYATPDSALVSAIWAMKDGSPKAYFESLTPDEQARMARVWENKSEAEVSTKHQGDVSKITDLRVVDRQEISPDQMTMSVYIGGVDRLEKVSMQRVGNAWKFGGFIREPKK